MQSAEIPESAADVERLLRAKRRPGITDVEVLDRNWFSGLERELGALHFQGKAAEALQAHVASRACGYEMPVQTISSWLLRREAQRQLARERIALELEEIQRLDLAATRRAELFAAIEERYKDGDQLTLEQNMKYELQWARIELERDKLRHENSKLRAQTERVKEAIGGAQQGEQPEERRKAAAFDRIQEIYGIPPGGGAAAAVPAGVDQ